MKTRRFRIHGIILALLCALYGAPCTAGTANAADAYTISDLGALPGATGSYATAINNRGQIVGSSGTTPAGAFDPTGRGHAFLWQDGTITDLGTLGGAYSTAAGINDAGQVVGTALLGGTAGAYAAFLWQHGRMTSLGSLPGMPKRTAAAGVNDAGQVIINVDGDGDIALWQHGTLADLGLAGARGAATAINDAGQVVGKLGTTSGRAFLWQRGQISDLGLLPGTGSSRATALNAAGQVVGYAADFTGWPRAFLWQGGTMTDLGAQTGYANSLAEGINAFGQVVGIVLTRRNIVAGFLWQNGQIVYLNSLLPPDSGWSALHPVAINDAGQIVGSGTHDGHDAAFLLTPTRPTSQYFAPTGHVVAGPFYAYWQAHGGLAINGYPISGLFAERLEDGQPRLVQYFERVRLEYHPEAGDPQYRVQLGQFGRTLHPADPPAAALPGETFFSVTGHNVNAPFMAYWNAHGGLAQFGYPISELSTETLDDGKPYRVQYFERARFELHPEHQPPYDVELGQFGRTVCGQRCQERR